MATPNLDEMEEETKLQYNKLGHKVEEISSVLKDHETSRTKSSDDLRELSGKIQVFIAGKLKQLIDLIEKYKMIERGDEPQSEPPLYFNDVQGYFDLTMIEARHIEEKIKGLLPPGSKGTTEESSSK